MRMLILAIAAAAMLAALPAFAGNKSISPCFHLFALPRQTATTPHASVLFDECDGMLWGEIHWPDGSFSSVVLSNPTWEKMWQRAVAAEIAESLDKKR